MPAGRALIGTSAVVVAGTLSLAEIERNERLPTTRQWIALAAAYLLVSIASDLGAEGLGGGLALLLMVSTLLVRGDDVLRFLGLIPGGKHPGAQPLAAKGGARGLSRSGTRELFGGPVRQVLGGP